ncbi:unnamed protein product, partial [Adineta steineri]
MKSCPLKKCKIWAKRYLLPTVIATVVGAAILTAVLVPVLLTYLQ